MIPISVENQPFATPQEPAPTALRPVAQAIVRNFASLTAGRFGSQVVGFVTNAYLARRISPSGFGAVSVAQAVLTYLGIFSDSGLSTIAVREGSQQPGKLQGLISSICALRLLLAAACMAVGLICAGSLPYSESSRYILRIYAVSLPVGAVAVDWVFRALQKMHYAAIVQIFGSALTLVLTIALIQTPGHALRVPVVALLVAVFTAALSLRFMRHAGYRLRFNFAPHLFRNYLSQSLPLCASSLAITLYIQVNYLILGKVHDEAAVGLYSAASRLAAVVSSFYWLYYAAMSPAFMSLYGESREAASAFFTQSVRLTAIVGFGMFAVGSSASSLLVGVAFGPRFAQASPALSVMLASAALVAVGHNWGQLAIAARREKLLLKATALGGATNLLLCFLLVKPLGPLGAAIGNLAAEVAVAVALFLPWPRDYRVRALRPALGPLLSCGCAVLAGLAAAPLGQLPSTGLCATAYTAALILTRSVTLKEIRTAPSALRFSRPPEAVPYA
jgi:O-antigen/teichoic acid export membrane protein